MISLTTSSRAIVVEQDPEFIDQGFMLLIASCGVRLVGRVPVLCCGFWAQRTLVRKARRARMCSI
nr:unnamed protein product [Callosobruchus chinensis]